MAIAQDNEVATDADDRTKPPFLRRVRIQGYKSIAFCDVALQPLTILVGRNAAGKSNFLDALAFLRDVLLGGIEDAVSRHGGRRSIPHRSARGSKISFRIEFEYPGEFFVSNPGDKSVNYFADYRVSFRISSKAKSSVLSERIRIRDRSKNVTMGFDRKKEDLKWVGFGRDASLQRPLFYSTDDLALGLMRLDEKQGFDAFSLMHFGLMCSSFHNFSPEEIRKHQTSTSGSELARDGRNLAGIIEVFNKTTIRRISAYLSAIVPGIEGFKVIHYGDFETVRFRMHSTSGRKPLEFDASSMSDGTLRALAALVAVFQWGSLPRVVGIEEPETSLHPAAMQALVDAMEEATGGPQILLATHSADLLADRDLHPSQILVVRNRDGQTLITPVDSASQEIIEKDLDTLADLQRQDHLDLDEADLQRQAEERAGKGGE